MATPPTRTDRPPPIDRSGNIPATRDTDAPVPRQGNGSGWRDRRDQRLAEQEKTNKVVADAAYRRATQGIPDQETRDRVLALGGDATRGSPVSEQTLPEPDPGLTTTTGSPSTPIDPTTAAVPAGENDPIVRRMRGVATVGGRRGKGEDLWKEPKYAPTEIPEEAEPVHAPDDEDDDL